MVTETINWLDANQLIEKKEYKSKQKELEAGAVTSVHGGGVPAGPVSQIQRIVGTFLLVALVVVSKAY
ncbi:hypothetical protein CCR75_005597 [Bremia lactucae]|uniref:Uncharacterized protein n=1 Tax=Bremia lactucae TaxID=4779 RepID=A0A976FPQ7_BRELC|nr:hypothetical protein CCR75_005597 [Bremia lactucae]